MIKNKLVLIIISVFLPPLAVFLNRGLGKDFLINIILTLLFFIPGMIHGIWVVTK